MEVTTTSTMANYKEKKKSITINKSDNDKELSWNIFQLPLICLGLSAQLVKGSTLKVTTLSQL
jgi:hypothetical protein